MPNIQFHGCSLDFMRRPTSSHATWPIPWRISPDWMHSPDYMPSPHKILGLSYKERRHVVLRKSHQGINTISYLMAGPLSLVIGQTLPSAVLLCNSLTTIHSLSWSNPSRYFVQSDRLARAMTTFSLVRVGKTIPRQEMMARKWLWRNGPRFLDRD